MKIKKTFIVTLLAAFSTGATYAEVSAISDVNTNLLFKPQSGINAHFSNKAPRIAPNAPAGSQVTTLIISSPGTDDIQIRWTPGTGHPSNGNTCLADDDGRNTWTLQQEEGEGTLALTVSRREGGNIGTLSCNDGWDHVLNSEDHTNFSLDVVTGMQENAQDIKPLGSYKLSMDVAAFSK